MLQTPSGDEVDRKSTINQEPAAATTVAAAEPVPAEPVLDESVPQETAEAGPEPEESVVPRLQLEEDEKEEDQLVVEEEPPLEQVSYINFRFHCYWRFSEDKKIRTVVGLCFNILDF